MTSIAIPQAMPRTVPSTATVVYALLVECSRDGTQPVTLASVALTGAVTVQTVRRSIRALTGAGWITCDVAANDKGQTIGLAVTFPHAPAGGSIL